MKDLKNKVVLITGAGKGRGRALAEAFAQRGAIVAANDISDNPEHKVDGMQERASTTFGGNCCFSRVFGSGWVRRFPPRHTELEVGR